ncbi:PD-(D/E)XK nuclease family protein [Clostridium tyrobutyricum]|nr:PD-(D/E)XK nuclease family protein [Clostridium tyrobutyricum]
MVIFLDIRKLEYFYYSQTSLNIFRTCPMKFKLKYIDNISWKRDDFIESGYYDNIEIGLYFHLICERYFSRLPIGKLDKNQNLSKWVDFLQETFLLYDENTYLTEYEIKMKLNIIKLQAKYDLIVIKPGGKIEIYDWKTENRKLSPGEMENRIQTLVYLYVISENAEKLFGINTKFEDISMTFWQPQYAGNILNIKYSEHKHSEGEKYLKKLIDTINSYDFNCNFNKEVYRSKCKFCEFNYICNMRKNSYF